MQRYALILFTSLLSLLLAGCQNETEQPTLAAPQAIESGDNCHVCGMMITNFPGPKGQAYLKGDTQARKFCSTLELFSFLKQPENETQISHAFVHDIGETDWQTPGDDFFIRASDAWYVIGHDQRGAMNHTLASFASQEKARLFCTRHGGKIIGYQDIDLTLLGQIARGEFGTTPSEKADCQPINHD